MYIHKTLRHLVLLDLEICGQILSRLLVIQGPARAAGHRGRRWLRCCGSIGQHTGPRGMDGCFGSAIGRRKYTNLPQLVSSCQLVSPQYTSNLPLPVITCICLLCQIAVRPGGGGGGRYRGGNGKPARNPPVVVASAYSDRMPVLQGTGAAIFGDPIKSIQWLATQRSALGGKWSPLLSASTCLSAATSLSASNFSPRSTRAILQLPVGYGPFFDRVLLGYTQYILTLDLLLTDYLRLQGVG